MSKTTNQGSTSVHRQRIKVKLDHRTLIVVNSMQDYKAWKSRYPDARIIK